MKSFFKSVLQQAVAQILVGIVLMGLAFVVLMVIIGKFAVSEVKVPKHSILVLNLNTNITDTPSQLGPQDLMLEAMQGMSTPSLYLHKVLNNIRTAAVDPRIRGLFLHGNIIPIDGGSGNPALR